MKNERNPQCYTFQIFTMDPRLSIHPKYTCEFMYLSKVGLNVQFKPIFGTLKDKISQVYISQRFVRCAKSPEMNIAFISKTSQEPVITNKPKSIPIPDFYVISEHFFHSLFNAIIEKSHPHPSELWENIDIDNWLIY